MEVPSVVTLASQVQAVGSVGVVSVPISRKTKWPLRVTVYPAWVMVEASSAQRKTQVYFEAV